MITGAEGRRLPPLFRKYRWLAAIVLFSTILRLGWAFYLGNGVEALPGIHDQITYHTLAMRVLGGNGFSFEKGWWPATRADAPTAHWSFLYTLYLAAVYFVFGPNPLAPRLIQAAVAGVLHPYLCWRIGRRLFGETSGLAAALFAAIYGYFIYYAGSLMTESFFILAVLAALDIATLLAASRIEERAAGRSAWAALGIAVGAAALLRQVFLVFFPFLLGWFAWVHRAERRRAVRSEIFRGILVACVVLLAMILPWTIRNYAAFKRFVLLNTNAGFAFFWANHPIHGTEFVPVLGDNATSYGALIPDELRRLDEASLDSALLREGLLFVMQDPVRYARLSLSRAREYFKFWPERESSPAANLVRTLSFGLFLPFMVLGIWVAARGHAVAGNPESREVREYRRDCHRLLLLFVIVFTLLHLLSWSLVRYRLPVDGVLLVYAGAGALWLVVRFSALRRAAAAGLRS